MKSLGRPGINVAAGGRGQGAEGPSPLTATTLPAGFRGGTLGAAAGDGAAEAEVDI